MSADLDQARRVVLISAAVLDAFEVAGAVIAERARGRSDAENARPPSDAELRDLMLTPCARAGMSLEKLAPLSTVDVAILVQEMLVAAVAAIVAAASASARAALVAQAVAQATTRGDG